MADRNVLPPRAIPVPEMPVPSYWQNQTLEQPAKEEVTITRFIDDHAPSVEGAVTSLLLVLVYAFRRRLRHAFSWLRK